MAKRSAIAIACALAAAGCSNVLGLKDPTFNDTAHDAAIDTPPIDAPIDMGPAACMPSACPFGCDPGTNMCRPAKLWVYLTIGAFFGDGFLGSPANVRATADALCFDTFSKNFADRACTKDRTHAILTTSGADSIQLMASTYSVPNSVEVDRAEDGLIVFDNWTKLTDMSLTPRAPLASMKYAKNDADGTVWTGFGVGNASNCKGWASKASFDFGVQGHTRTDTEGVAPGVLWLGTGSIACNLTGRLLCVCWSGGN